MNRERHALVVLACVVLALAGPAVTPAVAAAAKVEVRKMLDTATLGAPLVYDVGPGGSVLVLTRDNVYDAGAGEFLFGEPLKNPGWLAFAGDKLQLLVNGTLFVVDGRVPRTLIEAPLKNRIFASDGERTYISGITAEGKPVLFIYKEGVGHKPLVELDAPIDTMTLAQGELYFAVGPKIYTLREGGPARLFAHLPAFSHIPSIAVDEKHQLLYFSDGENIYAVHGKDFVVVRRGLGGILRFRDSSLYILSWHERAIFRMSGLFEAFSAAGALVPLNDPCKAPVLSLYCQAEEKRALLRSLAQLDASVATGDPAARDEFADYATGQKKEFERIMAALELEALVGVEAVLWGGGVEPKAIHRNAAIATEGKGVGLTLWDGSEARVGPDSKLVVDDCRPSGECMQTLEKGLMYFKSYKPPVEGMSVPESREFVIATAALSLRFETARLVVYASGDSTAFVVLDGRVKGVTPGGESVTVASGETLEVRRGERPGIPAAAEMGRLNKWWEVIR